MTGVNFCGISHSGFTDLIPNDYGWIGMYTSRFVVNGISPRRHLFYLVSSLSLSTSVNDRFLYYGGFGSHDHNLCHLNPLERALRLRRRLSERSEFDNPASSKTRELTCLRGY